MDKPNGLEKIWFSTKIKCEDKKEYYLKGSIDPSSLSFDLELTDMIHAWVGTTQLANVCDLHDTINAFKNNLTTSINKYVYTCKMNQEEEKNILTLTWKEDVDDDMPSIIVGETNLIQSQDVVTILRDMMNYNIERTINLRKENKKLLKEIDCIKCERADTLKLLSKYVNIKKQTEDDLFKKFILVLNQKKDQLCQLKRELDDYRTHSNVEDKNSCSSRFNNNEHSSGNGDVSNLFEKNVQDNDEWGDIQLTTPKRVSIDKSLIVRKPTSDDEEDENALDLGVQDGSDTTPSTRTKHILRQTPRRYSATLSGRIPLSMVQMSSPQESIESEQNVSHLLEEYI
ncbi:unnamed protein product [Didymodactylos carnosus]|uniref:XRCC4 coiled-coil domain-containing protein n=1 Tax=Didymodactylos carnosus TaxID=1234261 RepID=A0A813RI90_9BILA|nr:unnamed protein product [Didymodactylos carnosus]CAF3563912.1 unnamed protein product [Didymodactylos carnosus]